MPHFGQGKNVLVFHYKLTRQTKWLITFYFLIKEAHMIAWVFTSVLSAADMHLVVYIAHGSQMESLFRQMTVKTHLAVGQKCGHLHACQPSSVTTGRWYYYRYFWAGVLYGLIKNSWTSTSTEFRSSEYSDKHTGNLKFETHYNFVLFVDSQLIFIIVNVSLCF